MTSPLARADGSSPLLSSVADAIGQWNLRRDAASTDRLLTALHFTEHDWTVWQTWYPFLFDAGYDHVASLLDRLDAYNWYLCDLPPEASAHLENNLTCRGVLGLLCATHDHNSVKQGIALRDYAFVSNGWAYYAAGIGPDEAASTPVETAVAMAALRGITLPEVSR